MNSQPPTASNSSSSREKIRERTDDLKARASETMADLKHSAGDMARAAQHEASDYANTRKSQAADRLGSYGNAVRHAVDDLREQDPNIAWLADSAAERLERAADYVRDRNLSGMREDAEDFARRHPTAFLGGMFVAGVALGWVIKSARDAEKSGPASYPTDDDDRYDSDSAGDPVYASPTSVPPPAGGGFETGGPGTTGPAAHI